MIPSSHSSWEERELVDVYGRFRVVVVSPNVSSRGNGRWEWNAD